MSECSHFARSQVVRPIFLAVLMTLTAEAFYFVAWGLVLFPQGSIVGKFWWTLTCGIAMGSVIGAATIVFVVGRLHAASALLTSALNFVTVGAACALLCSRIDAHFNYFGGAENATLFILAGVVPALIAGLIYGWLLYSHRGPSILEKFGI